MKTLARFALFASFAFSAVAFAADAEPVAAPTAWEALLPFVVALACLAGVALLTLAVRTGLDALLRVQAVKDSAFAGMLAQFQTTMLAAIAHVDSEIKPKLVKAVSADSPGGSRITPEEGAELKAACLKVFADMLPAGVSAFFLKMFGSQLAAFTSGQLEVMLDKHQANANAGPSATKPVATPSPV